MTISFGTDGIRGKAGEHPLTPVAIHKIGQAIGILLNNESHEVIIGRDTRESGDWIEKALVDGLLKSGAKVLLGGIMPTAAVSCAVASSSAEVGVMITASHNPHEDNGLKFFGSNGKKLSDSAQNRLLHAIDSPPTGLNGTVAEHPTPLSAWMELLPKVDLSGMNVLLDGANGAAAYCAPKVLKDLGAKVLTIGCDPNGRNINRKVGALHPPKDLQGCDIGICLDGDADRIVLIDPNHGIIDGDDILWLLRNTFGGPLIGTIMSNGGLEEALGNRLLRSSVGDRHVAALMSAEDSHLGAEPSGHVLFKDGMPTGDGLFTALTVLEKAGRPPYNLSGFKRWPLAKSNIHFKGYKPDINQLSAVKSAKDDNQRVIVRYSGTESKLRILVEGNRAEFWVDQISTEFKGLLQ